MKITDVRAVQPVADNSPPDWRTTLGQILVAIDTDVGLTGYGVGGGGAAGIHVAATVLRDALLGRDPSPVESLWQELYRLTLPYGQKGLAIMALSGVDLALWDLRGKAADAPVAQLLGGSTGKAVPAYATVWDAVDAVADQGLAGVKLHVEAGPAGETPEAAAERVSRRVEEARRRLGPGPSLMIDAWMRWDIETTLAVDRATAGQQLLWIEEPLPADDLSGYQQLVGRCTAPIAGGEHEFTAAAFEPLIRGRLHQTLQPDACWCGGMTELVKIYKLAQAARLRVCPHRGSELWGLHAIAALDDQPLAESGREWMSWVGGQPPIIDGHVTLEDRPGFGAVIDESQLP